MLQKLKSFLANDALFYSVLLIGVAVASFGLGRQSVLEHSLPESVDKQEDFAEVRPAPTAPAPTPLSGTSAPQIAPSAGIGEVVASKSGTKYHLPTCAGAKQIKPENLISFASVAAAEAAGYTPAANCKGLQ
jgi:Metal binding domain of Ada